MRRRPDFAMANSSKVWCCGTLQTGVIAVAFTNMVSIILLSLWIMQVLVKWRHAFILVVIACLIVFVLIVANVCLIYGAMTKGSSAKGTNQYTVYLKSAYSTCMYWNFPLHFMKLLFKSILEAAYGHPLAHPLRLRYYRRQCRTYLQLRHG